MKLSIFDGIQKEREIRLKLATWSPTSVMVQMVDESGRVLPTGNLAEFRVNAAGFLVLRRPGGVKELGVLANDVFGKISEE